MPSPSFNNLKVTVPKLTKLISANGTFAQQEEWVQDGTIDIFVQPLGNNDIATLEGGSFSEDYKAYIDINTQVLEGDRVVFNNVTYEIRDVQENPFTQINSFPHNKLYLAKLTDDDQY